MKTVIDRLVAARAALITSQPFYGTLALHLELEERKDIPTAATDGKKCFYNPEFMDGLADDEIEFVIGHEAYHCANRHHTRRGTRDPELWNVACDYVLNGDMIQAGVGRMPQGGLHDPKYAGLAAEDVYRLLEQQQQQQKQQPQPQPQPGSGAGQDGAQLDKGADEGKGAPGDASGPGKPKPGASGGSQGESASPAPDPGMCGGVMDASESPGELGEAEAEWQTITRQAINVATKAAGKLPAHLERLATELNKPKANWREIMRQFVDPVNVDFNWQRPDRRFGGAPFLLPGIVKDGVNTVVLGIDLSGSITDSMLDTFGSEGQAIMDDGAVDNLVVLYFDTSIRKVERYTNGEKIKLKGVGGGGTDFAPVCQWAAEHEPDATAIIYLTDLCGPCNTPEPACPVLWVASGPYSRGKKMPFGEVIELGD
jgi:predicted metal-dependent peptidase